MPIPIRISPPRIEAFPVSFVPTSDKTFTAKFEEIPTYTIHVEADPEEGGYIETNTISESPIDHGDEYRWITVQENTEIYIIAEQYIGYRFLGWYDGDDMIYGPEYDQVDIHFYPTEDKTYTAKYEKKPGITIEVSSWCPGQQVNVSVGAGDDEDDLDPDDGDDKSNLPELLFICSGRKRILCCTIRKVTC